MEQKIKSMVAVMNPEERGEAKFWGFISENRCGMVLRNQPDQVTLMKRSELMIKPSGEDRAAAVQ